MDRTGPIPEPLLFFVTPVGIAKWFLVFRRKLFSGTARLFRVHLLKFYFQNHTAPQMNSRLAYGNCDTKVRYKTRHYSTSAECFYMILSFSVVVIHVNLFIDKMVANKWLSLLKTYEPLSYPKVSEDFVFIIYFPTAKFSHIRAYQISFVNPVSRFNLE